ncbi:MAG: hypothetical protein ACK50J_29385 [Planctomyces sp.]|jgi:hypothetical protein
MNLIRVFQRSITTGRVDGKLGQTLCWIFSGIVMVGGLLKVTTLSLTEPQFLAGLMLVVTVSLLGLIAGILLPIAQHISEKENS